MHASKTHKIPKMIIVFNFKVNTKWGTPFYFCQFISSTR